MSRALTLGNGTMLVGFDRFGRIRDLYFPYVGFENHIGGHHVHHIGVWVDGMFRWFGDSSWQISLTCENEALVSNIVATNEALGVTLHFTDVVYNEQNILIRHIDVTNHRGPDRTIKVFLGQQFEIYESHVAHTAYFDPKHKALIHYRGKRFFLLNGFIEGQRFQEYTTGVFGIEGREGSHRDAEDGMLAKNPIEHGPADSIMGLVATYGEGETKQIEYWVCVGESLHDVVKLDTYIQAHHSSHLIQTTRDFWKAWVNRENFSFYGLSEEVIDLFKKSLFIIRTHADNTSGAIIASTDSSILQGGKDTYSYVWPRDGAIVATALYQSGSYNAARRFFTFCDHVLTQEGYVMHKYGADETLGSSWHPWILNGKPILPIQEDETALTLHALWKYYELSKDLEFVESIYNSFVKRAADFMLTFRDMDTGLPKPSYDLWEEKYGVHTFTASVVSAALEVAGDFSELLGKTTLGKQYKEAAQSIRDAILEHLYDKESGLFYKMIVPKEEGGFVVDKTLDMSSVYGVYAFGVLPIDDERVTRAIGLVEEHLRVNTAIGGVARYEGDNYHRVDMQTPGNPWFVTTLWLAQYYIAAAKHEDDVAKAKDILEWCVRLAYASGIMPEQIHPYTGEHVSVGPLSWSHAEYVNTIIAYLDKMEELGICLACDPLK